MTGAGPVLPPLLLVGCGRMGRAMLDGWIARGIDASVVVDPGLPALPAPHRAVATLAELPAGFAPEAVVLAVKPQVSEAATAGIGARLPDATIVSIMAGRTVDTIARVTGGAQVVRAMPNVAAAIGLGITGAYAPPGVGPERRALATGLLEAVSEVVWLDDEALLEAVTAVSGSGPAYVYLLGECLERAGRRAGLPEAVARRLARRTLSGAGGLVEADPASLEAMRAAVTSKAGTTERAIAVLAQDGALDRLVGRAVDAAARRARELAS